ncbi:MAG: DUF45 domain-containing protein, partial [Clostridia bacterium]|nr:DUF45 domain-containing protein [Clostridia bacterium]
MCRMNAQGRSVFAGVSMAKSVNLTIDSFTVHVTRKKIKNLYLRVLPQEGVVINAPMHTTDAEIARFVRSRAEWIDQQQEKQALIVPRGYGDGEAVPYFGKNLTLRLIACTGRTQIALRGDALELTIRRDAGEEARKKAVDAWYKTELYEAAGAMLPAVERTVGKRAGELKVRDMKTRWGTCNIKTGAVTINLRLAEKPPE